MQLTEGSVQRLCAIPQEETSYEEHILQLLSIKQVKPANVSNIDRFRLILSDGRHSLQALLSIQLNHLVHNEDITKNTIAVIDVVSVRSVLGKSLFVVQELRVLKKYAEKIGHPLAFGAKEQQGDIEAAPTNQQQSPRPQLTGGSVLRLVRTLHDVVFTEKHILQFVDIKKIESASANTDRFRLILSDGQHLFQAILAAKLNHLVQSGDVTENTIAIIDKMCKALVQGKRLIVVLELRVLKKYTERVGQPVRWDPSVTPISELSPYMNNWKIKVRVVQKSGLCAWSTQRGEGKLFDVTFLDVTGEIGGKAFNAVADQLYERLEEGKTYYISGGRVNPIGRRLPNHPNEYGLSLENRTGVEECIEAADIPMIKYNFIPLSSLGEVAAGSICDVIGIAREAGPLTQTSHGVTQSLAKRNLTLVDRSNFSVRLTLWGTKAEQFVADGAPVIAFKGVRAGDFGGCSLDLLNSSAMILNPDIDEASSLRTWYDHVGSQQSFQSHFNTMPLSGSSLTTMDRAEFRNIYGVKQSQLGKSDKPDFFAVQATITYIQSDEFSYPACPTAGCNGEVIKGPNGWMCLAYDRSFEKPEHRYSMAVADWSGQLWLQSFDNDVGEAVFGMTAGELLAITDQNYNRFCAVMRNAANSKFNFACRAKQDTRNGVTRVRYTISKIQPVNYKEETKYLVNLLRSTWAM